MGAIGYRGSETAGADRAGADTAGNCDGVRRGGAGDGVAGRTLVSMRSASRLSQPVRSFRDLRAWQEAMQLTVALQPVCVALDRARRADLAGQLRRAATSVHANIAEGWGRRTPPDRQRFYAIAWSSLLETESLLAETALTHPALAPTVQRCATHARHTGRLLAALRRVART